MRFHTPRTQANVTTCCTSIPPRQGQGDLYQDFPQFSLAVERQEEKWGVEVDDGWSESAL